MQDQSASPDDSIDLEIDDHVVVVRPHGKLDLRRVQCFRRVFLNALTTPGDTTRDVVVDLSKVEFCDSSGLGALLHARNATIKAGRVLRLAAPTTQVAYLLAMTGTDQLFTIDPTPPL